MNTCFCTSAHLRFFLSWRRFAGGGGGKPLKRLTVAPPSLNTPLKQGVNESGQESRKNLRCAQGTTEPALVFDRNGMCITIFGMREIITFRLKRPKRQLYAAFGLDWRQGQVHAVERKSNGNRKLEADGSCYR